MDREKLKTILSKVYNHELPVENALDSLKTLPFEDLGFVKIDNHRTIRKGFPEVIFCQGKTLPQIVKIVEKLRLHNDCVMATRATPEVFQAISGVNADAVYHEAARVVVIGKTLKPIEEEYILVVSAGTSDIPVAEEAAVVAETLGNSVVKLFDVGVAGIHRLFEHKDKLFAAKVVIVVAGMEGALASIVGGLVSVPVIAVPTSIGYGANFGGLAPLLSMLNTCSPGVAVMNIDNGFGAGYFASLILKG